MELDLRDKVPPRFEGHADRIAYLLAEYRIGVYIALAALLLLSATDRLSVSVPPWLTTTLIGFAVGIMPSLMLGKSLADRWLPDPRVRVVEIDADGPAIEPHRVPKSLWEERETEELPIWQIREGKTDAVVTELDHVEGLDKIRVRGLNPELANPASIAARDGRLAEVFGDLQQSARELNAQEATEGMRQINTEDRAIMEIVRAVEKGTSVDPGAFDDLIVPESEEAREKEADMPPARDAVEDGRTLREMIGPSGPHAAVGDGGHENGQE